MYPFTNFLYQQHLNSYNNNGISVTEYEKVVNVVLPKLFKQGLKLYKDKATTFEVLLQIIQANHEQLYNEFIANLVWFKDFERINPISIAEDKLKELLSAQLALTLTNQNYTIDYKFETIKNTIKLGDLCGRKSYAAHSFDDDIEDLPKNAIGIFKDICYTPLGSLFFIVAEQKLGKSTYVAHSVIEDILFDNKKVLYLDWANTMHEFKKRILDYYNSTKPTVPFNQSELSKKLRTSLHFYDSGGNPTANIPPLTWGVTKNLLLNASNLGIDYIVMDEAYLIAKSVNSADKLNLLVDIVKVCKTYKLPPVLYIIHPSNSTNTVFSIDETNFTQVVPSGGLSMFNDISGSVTIFRTDNENKDYSVRGIGFYRLRNRIITDESMYKHIVYCKNTKTYKAEHLSYLQQDKVVTKTTPQQKVSGLVRKATNTDIGF